MKLKVKIILSATLILLLMGCNPENPAGENEERPDNSGEYEHEIEKDGIIIKHTLANSYSINSASVSINPSLLINSNNPPSIDWKLLNGPVEEVLFSKINNSNGAVNITVPVKGKYQFQVKISNIKNPVTLKTTINFNPESFPITGELGNNGLTTKDRSVELYWRNSPLPIASTKTTSSGEFSFSNLIESPDKYSLRVSGFNNQ